MTWDPEPPSRPPESGPAQSPFPPSSSQPPSSEPEPPEPVPAPPADGTGDPASPVDPAGAPTQPGTRPWPAVDPTVEQPPAAADPGAPSAPTVEQPLATPPPAPSSGGQEPSPPPPLPPANPAWPGSPPPLPGSAPRSFAPHAPGAPTLAGVGAAEPPFGGPPMPPPPLPPSPPPRRGGNRVLRALGIAVVVLGLVGIGFGARSLIDDGSTTIVRGAASVSTAPPVTVDPGLEPVAAVAQMVSPSVVQIETSSGLGSGVVYDQGLIMTNAHVVGSETRVTVRTADGQAHQGTVLGADTGTDVAVVKVDDPSLPVVKLAGGTPQVGQIAVAVGSPFGLDQTVTSGIVSAVNRPVDNNQGVVVNMIQTDASINPGNSGGALANREGQVIGINTAIFSKTGENSGIGFAIPIETAKKAADQIVAGKPVQRAALGVSGPSTTPNGDAGAYVQSATQGGPAADAGIQPGDLITKVDDTPVRSFQDLQGLISSYSPGDKVTVTVNRNGKSLQLQVTLGTAPGN